MDLNVFTKNQILEVLSKRGYFIDLQTLEAFFQKWKVEAIFENEKGEDCYDKNVLELVLKNVFENSQQEKPQKPHAKPRVLKVIDFDSEEDIEKNKNAALNTFENPKKQPEIQNIADETKNEAPEIDLGLNGKEDSFTINKTFEPNTAVPSEENLSGMPVLDDEEQDLPQEKTQELSIEKEENPQEQENGIDVIGLADDDSSAQTEKDNSEDEESDDFDDMNLLSESFEAQEKFKEYILSEMAKKNMMINPQPLNNEFKLDISEKTISMVARTLAKKIAKNINTIFAKDAKVSEKLAIALENNKKLEKKLLGLEEQNKKLRLLLAESNKNLNSYKPSIFGFYRKITPKN